MSGLLKPREPLQLALWDSDSGRRLGPAEAIEVVTASILGRGAAAGPGVASFNAQVRTEVRAAQAAALRETTEETGDPLSPELVAEFVRQARASRKTLHLPRAAAKAAQAPGRLVTWAVLNLALVSGLCASEWMREISPIRKRGPPVVGDPAVLRPISYVGDLEGFLDAGWLAVTRPLLEQFAGSEQAGGRYDATLMAAGLLIALQVRRGLGLRTVVQKADLLHGFDVAWRDGVLLQLRRAGLRGRWWLAAAASLSEERVRVRVGPLVEQIATLLDFGVGQGRRGGVHMFSALVRALIDACKAAAQPLPLAESAPASAPPPSLPLLQFVDDTFVLQPDETGVMRANAGLGAFCAAYRHRYQDGSKGPAAMAVGLPAVDPSRCGTIGGVGVRAVSQLEVLGIPVDEELSLDPLLTRTCAILRDGARRLTAALSDKGFGLPMIVGQVPGRVESAALYGTELLASHARGWAAVAAQLNRAYYDAAKALLGLPPGTSFGDGGYLRVFLETRLLTRVAAKVA